MPTHGTKKVAGLRSIQLHGLVLVCALAFSGPLMAQGIDAETADARLAPVLIDPAISTNELAASSVNFVCRPWTKTSDYWTVYWDLTHRMKEAFEAASITIPYPQQDVHIATRET